VTRPDSLMWVAVSETGGRHILSSDIINPLAKSLQDAASVYGVPVTIPLWDLDDSNLLSLSDVWSLQLAPVKNAARRYPSDALLLARVYQDENAKWKSDVIYEVHQQQFRWHLEADSVEALFPVILSKMMQTWDVAPVKQEDGMDGNHILLRVTKIDKMSNFAQVLHYLRNVPKVKSVELEHVAPGSVDLRVEFKGSMQVFKKELEDGQHLLADSAEHYAENTTGLIYQWLP